MNLLPSQKKLYDDILMSKTYLRRNNIIVFGIPQIGKSQLMQYISKKVECYKYVNFVNDYIQRFTSNKILSSLSFNDFQTFLRNEFELAKYSGSRIIIDEIEPIISIITGKCENDLIVFYKQLLDMDLSTDFVFVSSLITDNVIQVLKRQYKGRIYVLEFNKMDKRYIIKNQFNNINLFDLEQITNMRQFRNV